MQMILRYPDFTLGSYFTCEEINGIWRVNFIWTAHQGMQFDLTEFRKIQDVIVTGVTIRGHYGAQPMGNIARVGRGSTPFSDRANVQFGADFSVDLGTDLPETGTFNVIASYEEKTRAVETGQQLSGYQLLKGNRYYTFVPVSSVRLVIDYVSATSACTAPTEIALDREIAEDTAELSWDGAEGGTNNEIELYLIQHRDSADGVTWGDWVDDQNTADESASVTPNPVRGAYRQFRVCAQGEAGVAYQSEWIVSDPLRTNTQPGKPGAVVPAHSIVEADTVGLSWTAAANGLSVVASYRVERQVNNGEWTLIDDDVDGLSCAASMENVPRGQSALFRVCAVDTLGSMSAWSYSTPVFKNMVPPTPVIVWPASGLISLSKRPIFGISADADPEGQTMKLQLRKGANGTWIDMGVIPASGCKRKGVRLGEDLSTTNTGIYARLVDSLGVAGDAVSVTVRRGTVSWLREIESGSVIADQSTSHQADLAQMLSVVNDRREWFGFEADTYETEVGLFANWLPQMQQLRDALAALYATAGETVSDLPASSGYPSADVIDMIRSLCEGL